MPEKVRRRPAARGQTAADPCPCGKRPSSASAPWSARGSSRSWEPQVRWPGRRCGCPSSWPGVSPFCRATPLPGWGAVSLRRWFPGVRRPRLGTGPFHRRPGLVAPLRQRDHHRDGRRVLRQLCQRCGCRQRRLGQAVRRPCAPGDGELERPRLARGRQGSDGGGRRRDRDPPRVLDRHAVHDRHRPAGALGIPPVCGHRLQCGPDLLRLSGLRRHHLHRQGPRRSGPPATQGDLPRPRHRHGCLRRRGPGRVRDADRRRGRRLGRHRTRRRGRAGPRFGGLLADDGHGAVRDRGRDQLRALPGHGTRGADGRCRSIPPVHGPSGRWARIHGHPRHRRFGDGPRHLLRPECDRVDRQCRRVGGVRACDLRAPSGPARDRRQNVAARPGRPDDRRRPDRVRLDDPGGGALDRRRSGRHPAARRRARPLVEEPPELGAGLRRRCFAQGRRLACARHSKAAHLYNGDAEDYM